jgi:hypothetical protein
MVIEISGEQQLALDSGCAVPVHDGTRTYYVVPAEQFEKVKLLLEVEQADASFYEAGEIKLYDDQ